MLTFQLPSTGMPVSAMFEFFEHHKSTLNVTEYSLSQTSLEQVRAEIVCLAATALRSPNVFAVLYVIPQIFNRFASEQEGKGSVTQSLAAARALQQANTALAAGSQPIELASAEFSDDPRDLVVHISRDFNRKEARVVPLDHDFDVHTTI